MWEERAYVTLHFQVTVHPGGKSGQVLKAGSWRQSLRLALLTGLLFMACSACSLIRPKPACLRVASRRVAWHS